MKIKFMHFADFHMDAPFSSISKLGKSASQRRIEQRLFFKKAIEIAKERNIDIILISGDLFENKYVSRSTILYINDCLNLIPNIKVFISPGNHDPYIRNSYYQTHEWAPNVHIFKGELEKVCLDSLNACIYGVGFDDFLLHTSKIKNLKVEDENKTNILITHATLDNLSGPSGYHTIDSSLLKNNGLDYIALGHIHKAQFKLISGKAFYPGSAVALGFGEPGKHGIIMGEVDKHYLEYEFLSLDNSEYITSDVDVTGCDTARDVVDKIISSINGTCEKGNFYRFFISGMVKPEILEEIDLVEALLRETTGVSNILVSHDLIPEYDYDAMAQGVDLKALFVRKLIAQIENETDVKKNRMLKKALYYGISALEGRKVKLI